MLQQDQQQRQKFILNADIRMLEKRKNELLHDVEHMDASKKEEYKQFTTEIKQLTVRRNQLMEQVELTEETLSTLTKAYNESKSAMEVLGKTLIADATKEAQAITEGAKRIEQQALDKYNDASRLKDENDIRATSLNTKALLMESERKEFNAQVVALDTRKELEQKAHQQAEERMNEMQKIIRELEVQTEQLGMTKDAMIKEIGEAKTTIANELHVAEETRKKAEVLLASNTQKEKQLSDEKEYIRTETILLNDRRGQLERAIAEYQAKGVTI